MDDSGSMVGAITPLPEGAEVPACAVVVTTARARRANVFLIMVFILVWLSVADWLNPASCSGLEFMGFLEAVKCIK
jgi:hypothetical protein